MPQMLIDYYKAIEDSSAKMLAAAKAEDWDGVVRFEGVCTVLIEQLRARAQSEVLDAQSRAEKSKIMYRILNNDAPKCGVILSLPPVAASTSFTNSSLFLEWKLPGPKAVAKSHLVWAAAAPAKPMLAT